MLATINWKVWGPVLAAVVVVGWYLATHGTV